LPVELAAALAISVVCGTGLAAVATATAQAAHAAVSAAPSPTPTSSNAPNRVSITLETLEPKAVQPHDTVVLDGTGLEPEQMLEVARWTNLSETTFVLPPGVAGGAAPQAALALRPGAVDVDLGVVGGSTVSCVDGSTELQLS